MLRAGIVAPLTAATLTLMGGFLAPSVAQQAKFRDASNDVVNLRTDRITTTRAGIDVRNIRVNFSQRALRIRINHKNLTEANAFDDQRDGVLLDVRAGNKGPEWLMHMQHYHYQLYKIENYRQANNPRPRMMRFCGDRVRTNVARDTTLVRMPDRCFPQANRVRVYGVFYSKERGYGTRYDAFLGFREYTSWVRRR